MQSLLVLQEMVQIVTVEVEVVRTLILIFVSQHCFIFEHIEDGSFELFKQPFPGFLTILTI